MTSRNVQRLLLVEDTPALVRTYLGFLKGEPYEVDHVDTGKAAIAALDGDTAFDGVMLDLRLPDLDGIEVLRHIRVSGLSFPVVVITAHGSITTAVNAMREGAADFLTKPFNAERLKTTLANVLEKQQLTEIVKTYKEVVNRTEFEGFVGSSPSMQAVYRMIENVAASKATIFLTGESGTGKEVCAEAIRQLGPRRAAPMVALNCAAIPSELMESEIFGHVRGAFSGATADRAGAAAQADGGILFLDEICEMHLDLQAKLLRFLQTETFQPVGGSKVEKVDVRLICATNRDPWQEVEAGRFRDDLYYRLHVVPIDLPPLRQRGDDVMQIARHFLAVHAAEEGKDFTDFDPAVADLFMRYSWPGNVRQLLNVIQNVMVLHNGQTVTVEMLPRPFGEGLPAEAAEPAGVPRPHAEGGAASAQDPDIAPGDIEELARKIRPLADVERETIERAIRLCGDNVRTAAALLRIAPQTIYRKRISWAKNEDGGEHENGS